MFGIVKKLLGQSKKKEDSGAKLGGALRDKSGKLVEFVGEKLESAQEEFFSIKGKLKNLRETNYNLGLKFLEDGHLSDAIFRFRFIKKFWPDLYDAQYKLAYCLVLNKKPKEAQKVLEELFAKNPNYDQDNKNGARELLERVKISLNQPAS